MIFLKKRGAAAPSPAASETDLKSVTESLYKQNLELAVKNKTLSLLRQLYQISILALEPEPLGSRVVKTVRDALEFEMVGIFILDEAGKQLSPLSFAFSDRFKKAETDLGHSVNCIIPDAQKNDFFGPILRSREVNHVEGFEDICKDCIPADAMAPFVEATHIKTSSGYPLIIEGKLVGVLVLCLNRTYESLAQYEKESIASFIDVIAVALNKSFLYQELKVANEKLTVANARLKELDQQKSEFVSLASHQLRSPLTAIKGYISLILEGEFGDMPVVLKDPMERVFSSAQALSVMVDDFLNVSRIEQGRMKYDFSDFDVKKLVEQVIIEQRPSVEKAGLQLSFAPQADHDYVINADPGKIKQVITNLIDNSIKYTPKGKITVSLREEDGHVTFSVSDTGVGVPAAALDHLFNKFTRASNANQQNVQGTGLGLYVVKQMVEAHKGGRVWVESPGEGKGATFSVELQKKRD